MTEDINPTPPNENYEYKLNEDCFYKKQTTLVAKLNSHIKLFESINTFQYLVEEK